MTDDAITLELRPAAPAPTLGEPVLLELALHNGLAERVRVDLGHGGVGNLALAVRLPDGTVVEPPGRAAEGMALDGRRALPAGGTCRERLLLDDWLAPARPGAYGVTVRLTAPARRADGTAVPVPPSNELAVAVGARDAARLADVCRALAETVLHGRDAAASFEAARALARVADPAAVPFLAAVARHAGRGALDAVEALGRVGAPEAPAAAEALLAAAGDAELRPHARRALRALAGRVDDAALRARIARVVR